MTKEEDILRSLRRLEAMSRRKSHCTTEQQTDHDPSAPPRNHGRGRMLGVLSDLGPMSQTQLAAHLDIRPQSLSELIAKSESDGFIERKQSDEDKRQTIVSITEAGKCRVALFREAHRKRAEDFCLPLTDEEKNILLALLEKLISANHCDENCSENKEV